MKRLVLFGVVASLSLSILGCTAEAIKDPLKGGENKQIEQNIDKDKLNEESIISLVKEFGSKLQHVSLLSPTDILEESIKENYSDFVSQELLEKWIQNPENAPGRLTSSPWPDSIEVKNIEKLSKDVYKVYGNIIEVTSNKEDKAINRQIELTVKRIEDKWTIDTVTLGEYR